MLNKYLKIGVVGDLMLDIDFFCNPKGISQEAFVPVMSLKRNVSYPGGTANLAKNLSLLKCKTILFGSLGNDYNGKELMNLLKKEEINCENVIINKFHTTSKLRVYCDSKLINRIDNDHCIKDNFIKKKILIKIVNSLSNLDALIISDYDKGLLDATNTRTIIKECIKNKKRVYIDPKFKNWKIYCNSFLIKPNIKEMEMAADKSNLSQSEIFREAEKAIKLYNFHYILITMGEKGMLLVSKKDRFYIKSKKIKNANIVGAGDVVMAALVKFYESSKDIKKSVILANGAAGIGVSKFGTSVVFLREMKRFLINN